MRPPRPEEGHTTVVKKKGYKERKGTVSEADENKERVVSWKPNKESFKK